MRGMSEALLVKEAPGASASIPIMLLDYSLGDRNSTASRLRLQIYVSAAREFVG